MTNEFILKALKQLRETKKRKFTQSVDLIIALKDLNLKNPSETVDFYINLPAKILKKRKVCAFVGTELFDQAKKFCDKTITVADFDKYDKKAMKKLASEYDYFIAQANVMVKVAAKFGRVLGTRGKMPNPKAGCVVPPNANLQALVERLQSLVHIKAKKLPVIYVTAGLESASDDDLIKNITFIINNVIRHLPKEKLNIKSVYLKLTMSKPVKLEKY